ncbi:uncharacterized protein C1orf105 homolog isoform X4 [Mustela lutreola]|nr:uncharacterized protein C1orf105 homolog isoform X4 [Mustela lutreola]
MQKRKQKGKGRADREEKWKMNPKTWNPNPPPFRQGPWSCNSQAQLSLPGAGVDSSRRPGIPGTGSRAEGRPREDLLGAPQPGSLEGEAHTGAALETLGLLAGSGPRARVGSRPRSLRPLFDPGWLFQPNESESRGEPSLGRFQRPVTKGVAYHGRCRAETWLGKGTGRQLPIFSPPRTPFLTSVSLNELWRARDCHRNYPAYYSGLFLYLWTRHLPGGSTGAPCWSETSSCAPLVKREK